MHVRLRILSWGRYYIGEDGITAHPSRKEVELHVKSGASFFFSLFSWAFLYKIGGFVGVGLDTRSRYYCF